MQDAFPSRAYRPVILLLLVLCLGGMGKMIYTLDGLSGQVDLSLWRSKVQTLETKWTSGGVEYTVSTARRDAETAGDFVTRHDEVVTASQALHPPDTP